MLSYKLISEESYKRDLWNQSREEGESQGKCEFSTGRSGGLAPLEGTGLGQADWEQAPPAGIYRSESEKEEGLVHLHTSISSPATRWDSVWIRDSLDARNSTARSQTRFMRLLQREGPGSAGQQRPSKLHAALPREQAGPCTPFVQTGDKIPTRNLSVGGKGSRY